MKSERRRILIIVAIFLALQLIFFWRDLFPPKQLVPWRNDFATALQEARQSNKLVFAYFTASWCPPCQRLKRTTWTDPGVDLALRKYVPVEIDIDQHLDLAARYASQTIPVFVILTPDQQMLRSYSGYLSPAEFLAWLRSSGSGG